MRKHHLILGLILLLSRIALAGSVIAVKADGPTYSIVTITHYEETYFHWVDGDDLCIAKDKGRTDEIICGKVVKYGLHQTDIRFDNEKAIFNVGDELKILYSKAPIVRKKVTIVNPAPILVESPTKKRAPSVPQHLLIDVGLGTGFSYLYFSGGIEIGIEEHFSLGVMPLIVNDSGATNQAKAYGGFLTASYYFAHHFTGFRITGGAGLIAVQTQLFTQGGTQTSNGTPWSILGELGWRGVITPTHITFGAGVGLQYISPFDQAFTTTFSGLLPLVSVDIGYVF